MKTGRLSPQKAQDWSWLCSGAHGCGLDMRSRVGRDSGERYLAASLRLPVAPDAVDDQVAVQRDRQQGQVPPAPLDGVAPDGVEHAGQSEREDERGAVSGGGGRMRLTLRVETVRHKAGSGTR